jgi:hypothetical protein
MRSRTFAGIHVLRAAQLIERIPVHVATIALSQNGMQTFVRLEPEPGEVLENARFVFGPAADAIVILHAEQHASGGGTRHAPHVYGVDHVTEMKVTRRGRGVACEHLMVYGKFILH